MAKLIYFRQYFSARGAFVTTVWNTEELPFLVSVSEAHEWEGWEHLKDAEGMGKVRKPGRARANHNCLSPKQYEKDIWIVEIEDTIFADEIESWVFWKGLQSTVNINIALKSLYCHVKALRNLKLNVTFVSKDARIHRLQNLVYGWTRTSLHPKIDVCVHLP